VTIYNHFFNFDFISNNNGKTHTLTGTLKPEMNVIFMHDYKPKIQQNLPKYLVTVS